MMGRNIKMAAVAFTAIITLTGCGTKLYDMTDAERFDCVISRHCQTMSERQAVLQQLIGEKSELTKYAQAMLAEQESEPVSASAPDTGAQ